MSANYKSIKTNLASLALAFACIDNLSDAEREAIAQALDHLAQDAKILERENINKLSQRGLEVHDQGELDDVAQQMEEQARELADDITSELCADPEGFAVSIFQRLDRIEDAAAGTLQEMMLLTGDYAPEDEDNTSPLASHFIALCAESTNWLKAVKSSARACAGFEEAALENIEWDEIVENLTDCNTDEDDEERRTRAAQIVAALALTLSVGAKDTAQIQKTAEGLLIHLQDEMNQLDQRAERMLDEARPYIIAQLETVRDSLDPHMDGDEDGEMFCDVRLQVEGYAADESPTWCIHSGPSDYDQSHKGAWGASCVAPDSDREAIEAVADELISQALDMVADSSDRPQTFEPPAWQLVLGALEEISGAIYAESVALIIDHPAYQWARNWTQRNR